MARGLYSCIPKKRAQKTASFVRNARDVPAHLYLPYEISKILH